MAVDAVSVEPRLVLLYRSTFDVATPIVIGGTPIGLKQIIPITGGRFEGPKLSGEVLPFGADWQLVRQDGVVELEARYVLKTGDGALISVRNLGIVHAAPELLAGMARGQFPPPDRYYFRTSPIFETSHAGYQWLQQRICVATGEARPGGVLITVYTVE
jgi:hypothetical protein